MKNKTLIGNSSLWENDCFCARFNEGEKDNIYKTMEKKTIFLIEVNEITNYCNTDWAT